jgi:hypothetical protein
MKSINWKRGFFRLTLVLCIPLAWLLGGDQGEEWFGSGAEGFFLGVFIFLGLIWLLYFIVMKALRFVVTGFMDKD